MDYRSWDQDSVYPSFSDPFFPSHLSRYFFATRFAFGKKVLDLGCGKGYGTRVLAEVSSSVLGVDLNPESIEFAKTTYSHKNLKFDRRDVRVITDDIRHSFDVIVSFEVLEHLSPADADVFMKTIKGLLKIDGVLILSTPNHDVVTKSGMPVPEFHINNLKSTELKAFLLNSFSKVEVYGQIENRHWLETAVYYLDIFNLRHSKIIKRFRKSAGVKPPAEDSAVASVTWKHEMGAGISGRYLFSKRLWRQAGMSLAVCQGKKSES